MKSQSCGRGASAGLRIVYSLAGLASILKGTDYMWSFAQYGTGRDLATGCILGTDISQLITQETGLLHHLNALHGMAGGIDGRLPANSPAHVQFHQDQLQPPLRLELYW